MPLETAYARTIDFKWQIGDKSGMRPAGKGPLESLYFTYPRFAAKPAPEQQGRNLRHQVAIVGAGPVGMLAALMLARQGVASVLLDRKQTFNDGSRAVCLARQSLQILQQAGAVAPFLAKALGWRRGRSFYRGHEIYRLEMPHADSEKYLPMYNLQQQYIEQFLNEAIEREALIETRWQSEVIGLTNVPAGVALQVDAPDGPYRLHADWLIAADGARSSLRNLLGLRLRGENYEGRYVIADVRMRHDYPTERRAFFEPRANPGGTVLVHKQPEDIWRIDYQLRPEEDADSAVQEAEIRRRVGEVLSEIGHVGPWELEWWSIYTANTLCLDDYRHGRAFFIGDAAHIVPIFGVRGLNSGLADAQNLAWKLGYVLRGLAHERLLDSYSPERRAATLDVFANASKSTRFMTPPSRGWALMREAALSLAISQEFVRPLADPRQMRPYSYAAGPLACFADRDRAFESGPMAGSACPNARIDDGRFLLDLAGNSFTLLLFDADNAHATQALIDRLRAHDPALEAIIVVGGEHQTRQAGAVVRDRSGEVGRVFSANPGTVYLLRPDLHIAARWRTFMDDEIEQALRVCLGKEPAG